MCKYQEEEFGFYLVQSFAKHSLGKASDFGKLFFNVVYNGGKDKACITSYIESENSFIEIPPAKCLLGLDIKGIFVTTFVLLR